MVNAKKKGNRGESVFSEFLRENGFKAFRDSASGASTHKSDIVNGMDYSMEIKTVKKIGLKEAWKQVSKDSSIAHNTPLLAIHFDGMPEKEWIVCLHSNDWIELEKLARQTQKSETKAINSTYTNSNSDRELLWLLAQLKSLLGKTITKLNEKI